MPEVNRDPSLKPSFEDEFPDTAYPDDIETQLRQGRINASEAREMAERRKEAPSKSLNPTIVQTSVSTTSSKDNPGNFGSFGENKDGSVKRTGMSPSESRMSEALPEEEWKLR